MQLRVESLAKGGESVARLADGRVVFLDSGAPGDLVDVELVEEKARFARGVVRAVVERGAARVDAPCVYAARCGGCPWQSVRMDVQQAAKLELVQRALAKLSPVEPLCVAPRDLGYRIRATLHERGKQLGFYARRSHEIVAIESCIALDPRLDDAVRRLQLPSIGEEGTLRATIVPSGEVLVAIASGRGADRKALLTHVRALVDAGVIVGGDVDGTTVGAPLADANGLAIAAAGFRQANDAQNDVLRALVRESLDVAGRSLLELYAGDGNFTRDATTASSIVAIEEDAAAIARLRKNVPTAKAIVARVERELERQRGQRYDRVLLDPPRAGAKEAMPALLAISPERIVYVSCDVATLARDLGTLSPAYAITRVVPVDMMPHTDHVEVVATLQLR